MDVADLRAELELELQWREEELRRLRNSLRPVRGSEWSRSSMRAIILMEYAHIEGFSQFALGMYALAVRRSGKPVRELKSAFLALALQRAFTDLRQGRVHVETLDDAAGKMLRRARRHVQIVGDFRSFEEQPLPEDATEISFEMNVGRDVLQRNLLLLGLEDVFTDAYGMLEWLRRRRNDIGHGQSRLNISDVDFQDMLLVAEAFRGHLVRLLTEAFTTNAFAA